MECELCELAKGKIITKLWYQDNLMIIVDCKTCVGTPLVVFKGHKEPTLDERMRMIDKARELFPDKRFDFQRRAVPDHYHFHMR